LHGQVEDYIEVIKKFGGHLDCFHCSDHSVQANVEWAKQELKDQFDKFTLDGHHFTAKKKGFAEKFWNWPEMSGEYQYPRPDQV
jgi:hypothetical protein